MFRFLLGRASMLKRWADARREAHRWRTLREMGMQIGKDVWMPMSTWIDTPHCFLISIGDGCVFGDSCAILAHDAMPERFVDGTRIGRVRIREDCHFGMRSVILPGVEIGPRVVVAANSVVATDIPPNSVARGVPAKVLGTLDDYIEFHRLGIRQSPSFPYAEFSVQHLTPERRREMLDRLGDGPGYITGGHEAILRERDRRASRR